MIPDFSNIIHKQPLLIDIYVFSIITSSCNSQQPISTKHLYHVKVQKITSILTPSKGAITVYVDGQIDSLLEDFRHLINQKILSYRIYHFGQMSEIFICIIIDIALTYLNIYYHNILYAIYYASLFVNK